jgi:hypothetical protein
MLFRGVRALNIGCVDPGLSVPIHTMTPDL